MEENENIMPEEVAETVAEVVSETAAETEPSGEGEAEATAPELRALGREIADGLREVIGEEIDRRLRASDGSVGEGEEGALALLLSDPRFLRILSERLSRDDAARRADTAPTRRRRGAQPLPASAVSAPKTLDDARAAARKYFRID